ADLHRRAAVNRDAEEIVHARNVTAGRREVEPAAVARPCVELIKGIIESEAAQVARVERQDVDVAVAGARGDEGELFTVGRIERARFVRRMRDEQTRRAAR